MMDDYLFDGLGPSPEALQAWDESRAAREAAEQERAPPTIEEQLEHEKARAAALEDELKAARGETEAWVRACVEIKILRRVRIVAWSSTPSTQRLLDGVNAPDALVDSTQAGTQPRAATPQLRGNGVVPVAQRVVER